MSSTNVPVPTRSTFNDKSNLQNIYEKFQSFIGRRSDSNSTISLQKEIAASGSMTSSEDSFITSVSSIGDLLGLSPKKKDVTHQSTGDLLTGAEFDSICDVTMQEIPNSGDMFIDANSIDYLVKCAESNRNHNLIDRGKESLFVKFDPLYAKKCKESRISVPTDTGDNSETEDVGYETGSVVSSVTDCHVSSPKHSLSTGCIQTHMREKPTQVVPPVISNEKQKSTASQTRPPPTLMRSVSAILTPTRVATDRLISISGTTPPTAAPRSPRLHNLSFHEVERMPSLRNILHKQSQEMLQLEQENRELRSSLQDMEHKLSRTTTDFECKLKKLSEEKDSLFEQVNNKNLRNKQMSIVMEEYERTISSMIQQQHSDKIKYEDTQAKIIFERDQALNHLTSMESSFNDLLSKYEKCKSVIIEAKEREAIFNQKITEYEEGMNKYDSLYNTLKQVTSDSLAKANETLESIKKGHSVEIAKLSATIKKHEITIASLQESLAQKTRDNEELTRICDQLINEVR